ncbi:MAG: methylmalonyl-CoA mutase [Devosiaceae bacterium]|nr:methylmalonyl-CoA mutase [Devosiaceae bacterium MH13]
MDASGFDSDAFAAWKTAAEKALKGEPLSSLTSTTDDGLALAPLYAPGQAPAMALRGGGTSWRISQRIDHPDPDAAYEQVADELEGGASGLVLSSQGSAGALGYGLSADALPDILRDVLPDAIRFTYEPSAARIRDARHLAKALDAMVPPNRTISVDFGLDAPSLLAASGGLRGTGRSTQEAQSRHFAELQGYGFAGTIYRADGRVVHRSGGTDAQELGFVLSSLVFMLRSGDDTALQAQKTLLGVALDADQFAGIAKLRALRQLHAGLLDACGIAPTKATIAGETSWRMLTRKDAHVNMLRTTTAVLAGAVGGADIITALPFSQRLGYPNAFARRVARNTQHILDAESHLAQVDDPAAGSGLFDSYTQALSEAAWAFFQQIEARGGVVEALSDGFIQTSVAEARAARAEAIASGARKLTGSTVFPLETEYPVEVLDLEPVSEPLKDGLKTYCEPLPLAPLEPDAEAA